MNWSHLQATLWLRWRILRNRIRRTGKLSNALFGLLLFFGLCVCVGAFFVGLTLGMEFVPEADQGVLFTWLGLTLGFLFAWTIGLVTDLQRSDAMSFKNLLHLPVSLGWVFLYNYLSSFVSLSVAIFLPAMLGLSLAMLFAYGAPMLLCIPLLLAFFVMVTGLTYQLRGWLARLMENKRRSRNIIAAITVGFVLLAQAPYLINLSVHRESREERRAERAELAELRRIAAEKGPEQSAAKARLARRDEERAEGALSLEHNVTLGTMLIPVGWLPYGVRATSEGRWWIGSLCALGMLSIGGWSLRRSFRATMLSVVGGSATGQGVVALQGPGPSGRQRDPEAIGGQKPRMVERSLPFTSERVAGIALASLRSLLRAPEAKMLLLSPLILLGLLCVMLSRGALQKTLGPFTSAMGLGAISMGLLSIFQLLQNQFGLDRGGFRAYVLSPVPREQILLGKNLGNAPVGIGISLIALIALQFLVPVDVSHFLGSCMQLGSAYMLLCVVGNMMSILGPMRLKDNGLKAANAKFMTVFWQMLSFVLIPITLSPLVLPSVAEFLLGNQDWTLYLPVYPLLHAVGLIGVYVFYRWMLRRQGELLQDREQHILDVLTRD